MRKIWIVVITLIIIAVIGFIGWAIPDVRAGISDFAGGTWFVLSQAIGGALVGIATTPLWIEWGNFISAGLGGLSIGLIAIFAHRAWNWFAKGVTKLHYKEMGVGTVSTPTMKEPQAVIVQETPVSTRTVTTEPAPKPEVKEEETAKE